LRSMRRGALAVVSLWLIGCLVGPRADSSDVAKLGALDDQSPSAIASAIEPLPETIEQDARKVALGERLFVEPRLSGDGRVACKDCHALDRGGANGQRFSDLPGRKPVPVNVPSIFNVAFDFRYAWNGRYEDLESLLDFAMNSPRAMAGTWAKGARAISDDVAYVKDFRALYPQGLDADSLRDALVAYSRSLITPNAPFDRFLRGKGELSAEQQRGYETFRDYGCISCHQGKNIGGNMYQRFGVMRDYFADRGGVVEADLGRYTQTQREEDRFVFRVPSLRNVALTAPYFHDGSADTLEAAVTTMARYQLGRALGPEQTADIVAFLRTLSGEYRQRPL
jgi:cytochrome c peroxidase